MQKMEAEEARKRQADMTALQAIGPRKQLKLIHASGSVEAAKAGNSDKIIKLQPARVKRVNFRDLLFQLEEERDTRRSTLLYKSYLK